MTTIASSGPVPAPQHPAPHAGAPLLSYPLKPGDPCILSSEPAAWAQQTAFDIREHDRDRFLDAKHGSKIEEFWTAEFIQARGREYCEALLQYIICFNHEEVGGTAVMWMDQMMMWQPHYFPYSMKYRHRVEEFFEEDQIEHYGRKFLETVVEWCKGVYRDHRPYWDNLLEYPPAGQNLDAFVAELRKKHCPQMLKEMKIVPESRPDDWPCNYFSRARGKTTLPQQQPLHQRVTSIRKTNAVGKGGRKTMNAHAGTQPKDADANDQAGTQPSSSNTATQATATTQAGSGTGKRKKTSARKSGPTGLRGGDDDGNDSDDEDKEWKPQDAKLPQSPKSKKTTQSDDEGDNLKALGAVIHRRVKSEADSPVKKEGLSLQDWMTAPGMERRAVSSQEQSQLLEKTMHGANNQSNRVPNTGRGGAEAAIGRYQYGPGSIVPSFTHPYTPDMVAQNNAAYLYHQDHSFGRSYPPRPDHSTTYRPGSNIYQTDPQRGDMFMPVAQPQPHFSYHRMPSGLYGQQQGYYQPHGMNQIPGSAYSSPHTNAMAPAQPMLMTPPILPTAPHGVVPYHIMEPYLQAAAQGAYPQHHLPLSRVGQPPTHPGYPAMRQPQKFVTRAPGAPSYGPHIAQSSPRVGMSHQIIATRGSGPPSTSYAGPRNARRDMVRSEPVQLSPRAASFHLNNPRPLPHGPANVLPIGPAAGLAGLPDRPPRVGPTRQYPRHNSASGETIPFPMYDEMLDPTGLPESQQCTSTTIGPDAEDVVTLWFADIPQGTTTDQLRNFIEQTMPVAELKAITFDQKATYAKGWSFVKFLSNTDARRALDTFQGAAFNGGHLKVQVPERRTNNPGRRNRPSFRTFGLSQTSDQADGFMGYQPSFSGSNNSPARFRDFGVGASPSTPRRSRGNSMSQAIHAVRRNSTFSKQDARSDLPLGNLPEVAEASKPTTPTPEQQPTVQGYGSPSKAGDEHVEAVKKPGKKKPKKKKKPHQSRDGSVAPSDSNISSVAGSSATPRFFPVDASADETKAQEDRANVTQPRASSPLKSAVQLEDSPTKPDAQTREEFVVGAISDFEDGAASTIAASEKAMSEDTVVHTPEDDLAVADMEVAHSGGEEIDVSSADADTEAPNDNTSADAETETITEQSIAGSEEPEATASVTSTSDHKSEATTVPLEQPTAASSKAKAKGPAQTESLSMFGLSKQQKKSEKNKAKKARQASRKVSKTLNLATMEVPKAATAVTESSTSVGGKENRKASRKDKQAASQSSSLAGTPETAREYPASLPNTPSPKLATVATPTEGTSKSEETEQPVTPENSKNKRRRSTALEGTLSTSTDPPSATQEQVDSFKQPSLPRSPPSGTGSLPQPKVKAAGSAPMKTWAQITKGVKAVVGGDGSGGLTERDINVQR